MQLVCGPPGSGKTTFVLKCFREALAGGGTPRLIAPTSTMAQHLRNLLAREGWVLRRDSVLTLARFTGRLVPIPREASSSLVYLLAARALEENAPDAFRRVAGFPGFRDALARSIEEAESAGTPPELIRQHAAGAEARAMAELYRTVERELAARGFAMRGSRLRAAAAAVRARLDESGPFLFDGFFSFTGPEIDLVAALAARAGVVVTLPSWEGAERSRARLLEAGFAERRLEPQRSRPAVAVVAANNGQREAGEVARRILDEWRAGRAFREMGVVLRGEQPYAPLLGTAFERFGIPARFYFAQPLARQPAIRRACAIVGALLSGWDYANVLDVVRLTPGSGELDFRLRAALPGRGLPEEMAALRALEPWTEGRRDRASWAAEVGKLREHAPGPDAVWDAFTEAAQEAALTPGEVPFAVYWAELMEAVERTSLYPDDKRRDIVHVMDVYEARQWELPVVFVCGLLEQEFPRYHRQDAVLGDADRVRLQAAGIHLRTTADRQREERFLFDFAASRATELLVLSYPRFRPGGEETLPSFVLERFPGSRETARNAAARPRRSVLLAPPSRLPAGALEPLAARLSPSAVESYLQCPFLYFARHALGIEGAPPAPGDRLDFLARGSIVHRVLAGYTLSPLFLEELFHRAFDAECAQRNAVAGYRTESLRQDLLEDLRRFAASPPLADSATLAVEKTFEYPAGEGVTVRGRVDRVVRVPGGIVVIDYKYSAPAGVRKTAAAAEDGAAVQAGIYLLAMARSFHAAPAGALYCGLKKEVRWEGWHVPLNGWEDIGQTVTRRELEELAARSAGLALEAARGIRAGRVGPEPRDPGKCGRCEFRDICRIEEAAAVRVREAGA